MSDTVSAIMDDLWANEFVPRDTVLNILAQRICPLEAEIEKLRVALKNETEMYVTCKAQLRDANAEIGRLRQLVIASESAGGIDDF